MKFLSVKRKFRAANTFFRILCLRAFELDSEMQRGREVLPAAQSVIRE